MKFKYNIIKYGTFLILSAIPITVQSESLQEYKDRIKSENIESFYAKRMLNKYRMKDILESLIGVAGSVPIGTIRSEVNRVRQKQKDIKQRIDNCGTKQCIRDLIKTLQ